MSSHDARRAILSASGLPVPFSMRDKVDADTPVLSATSRRLKPCCSRRRRTALPSSEVLTPVFFTMGEECITHRVLAATLCFMVGTKWKREVAGKSRGAARSDHETTRTGYNEN